MTILFYTMLMTCPSGTSKEEDLKTMEDLEIRTNRLQSNQLQKLWKEQDRDASISINIFNLENYHYKNW